MECEVSIIDLIQKYSDSFKNVFEHLNNSFCSPKSQIFMRSNINSLYGLRKYLNDQTEQDIIFSNIMSILRNEFNVQDIEVFYELIELYEKRNVPSQSKTIMTLEELKLVSNCANELYDCLRYH